MTNELKCTCKGVLGHSRQCAMFDESKMEGLHRKALAMGDDPGVLGGAAGASEGQADRKLDKPAQVSHTSFGVGVSWSTVIGAAQRHYEYRHDKSVPRSYPDRYNLREIDALKLFPVDQSQRQFVDYVQYLALQREFEATSAEIAALRERLNAAASLNAIYADEIRNLRERFAGMEKDAEIWQTIITSGLYDRMNDITGGDREARHLIEEMIAMVDPLLQAKWDAREEKAKEPK